MNPKPKQQKKRALILSGGGARGAYQVGVLEFLSEKSWSPDIVCGTSVGAINAVGIGCGLTADVIKQIWMTLGSGRVYRFRLFRKLLTLLRPGVEPLSDSKRLKELLLEKVPFEKLKKSPIDVFIMAINIVESRLKYFTNETIQVEHLLAASAVPLVFPCQTIDNTTYWDAGSFVNTPLAPAISNQAEEIVVVMHSPVAGHKVKLPQNNRQALVLLVEQFIIGSYATLLAQLYDEDRILPVTPARQRKQKKVKIHTVAPDDFLGLRSLVSFKPKNIGNLIERGYNDAARQLKDL